MIDYSKIHAFEQGQRSSFEELVCQLGRQQKFPKGSVYRRVEGAGGDGGLEAYWTKPNGKKTGYQAKFHLRSRDIDWRKIDESVTQALKCHPQLECYVIALPCDLTDRTGMKGKGGTGWERWDARVKKWKFEASTAGISDVEFVVWSSSEITGLLINPGVFGLRDYFFGEIELSLDWFERKVQESVCALDERFHPEDHVDVHTEKLFPVISRSQLFKEELLLALDAVREWSPPRKVPSVPDAKAIKEAINGLETAVGALSSVDEQIDIDPQHSWNVPLWRDLLLEVQEKNFDLQKTFLTAESSVDEASYERLELRGLVKKTWKLDDSVSSMIKLTESRYMEAEKKAVAFIRGSAGSGKSHLLAKCAENAIQQHQPATMVLGQHLNRSEFWSQLAQIFGLPGRSAEDILGALDAAGKRSGVRALLLIDAINEGVGSRYWREHIASVLQKVSRFTHVACVISCRAEYFELAVPDSVRHQYPIFSVRGFETPGEQLNAARVYLDRRGIARPSTPWFSPEFVNPLFLRSVCVALERDGKSELPPGLTGTKRMLSYYLKGIGTAISQKEESTVSYAPILGRAVLDIAGKMVELRADFLDMESCRDIVARHFRNLYPRTESDWLSVFLNNGLLRRDPNPINDVFSDEEVIRFSFQRFQDFLMAERLLEGVQTTAGLFDECGALGFCLEDGHLAGQWIGLIDALSVLFPETLNAELVDALPGNYRQWWSDWSVRQAFAESIKWRAREETAFGDRALELLNELPGSESFDLLLEVAVSSNHPFNSEMLHKNLVALTLPNRDAFWTMWVNSQDDVSSTIGVLIEWCRWGQFRSTNLENQYLASVVLCWLFASSNRAIRDRATKALANILIEAEGVFPKLLEKFSCVDDAYVLERLMAAAYGACCLDPERGRLISYSELIFDNIFEDGSPPFGILLRDYALGIIELASYHSVLPSRVDLSICKPPYKSSRIRLSVSETQLENVANRAGDNEIASSATGFMGDFSRYEIEPRVRKFLRVPLTKQVPLTAEQKIQRFVDEVLADRPSAVLAFDRFRNSLSPFSSGFWTIEASLKGMELTKEQLGEWKKSIEIAEKALLDLLTEKDRRRFLKEVSPNLSLEERVPREELGFDFAGAKRWIAKRAYDYGWTLKRFESDRYVGSGYSRSRPLTERIGKKYQWLALDEFLSRVADNYWMNGEFRENPKQYTGPLDLGYERDIDPTILSEHQEIGIAKENSLNWVQGKTIELENVSEARLPSWPFEHNPSEDLKQLPIRVDSKGVQWIVLYEHQSRSEKYPEGIIREHDLRREEFRILSTVLVKKDQAARAAKLLEKEKFSMGLDWCIDSRTDTAYLAEAPWRDTWNQEKWHGDSWISEDNLGFAQLAVQYAWESHLDASLPEGWGCYMPAPWLAHELKLRADDRESGIWRDESGEIVFLDVLGESSMSVTLLRLDRLEKIAGSDHTFLSSLIAERRACPGGAYKNFSWRRAEGVCWNDGRGLCTSQWVEDTSKEEDLSS